MPLDSCIAQQIGRRRVFWATQPLACGEYFLCGSDCVIPGLEYVNYVASAQRLAVREKAAATDTQSAVVDYTAAVIEAAAAIDTQSAVATRVATVVEAAAAVDLPDVAGVLTKNRIISASRTGTKSAVVTAGNNKVITDIGVVI